jgi:cytochrome c553
MSPRLRLLALLLLILAASSHSSVQLSAQPDRKDAAKPVESDMHEFMEYVFEPTYKRLKPAIASAPADNKGWKAIKADSLILAESGNLLLIRQPEKDATDWVKHSTQVRDTGGKLYEAAKAKDYAAARKHYESMIQNCNACHKQFANGEYTLSP